MSDQNGYPDVAPAITEEQGDAAPLDFDIGVGGDRWRNFRQDVLVPVPVQGGDSYSADIGQVVNPDGSILDLTNFLRMVNQPNIGMLQGSSQILWINPASPLSAPTVVITPAPYTIIGWHATAADSAATFIVCVSGVSQPGINGSVAFTARDITGAAHGTGEGIVFSYAIFLAL